MKRSVLSVWGVLMVLTVFASAEPPPSGFGDMNQALVFTPGAGLLFPVGDFDNQNDLGFSVGSGLEYFVSPRLALLANYSYHSFADPSPSVSGESFHFLGLGARAFLFRDARLNPYLRAAGGLYQAAGGSKAGANAGPGVLYRVSKNVGLYAEGGAHFVFDYGSGVSSSTANFLGLTAGLALTIPTGQKAGRKVQAPPVPEPKEPPPAPKREEPKPVEIVLASIYFDVNQDALREDAKRTLGQNAELLRRHPSVTIEIQAHTDERGNAEYNRSLGRRRAESARRYLLERGVDGGRMSILNFGEGRPLETGHGEPSWAKNRRVDFRIISR
ncbi:MAG: OmpA family protein [candidate division Zixibacteria bacterium]|nr:OmpA family protein [candidate division Zixibacteria bacterium]MCI0595562.1 OmpA family protein [candidate division Zixibacteria bacterium]